MTTADSGCVVCFSQRIACLTQQTTEWLYRWGEEPTVGGSWCGKTARTQSVVAARPGGAEVVAVRHV